jgi:hypothetical protein
MLARKNMGYRTKDEMSRGIVTAALTPETRCNPADWNRQLPALCLL